jgi:hypothetical protein
VSNGGGSGGVLLIVEDQVLQVREPDMQMPELQAKVPAEGPFQTGSLPSMRRQTRAASGLHLVQEHDRKH